MAVMLFALVWESFNAMQLQDFADFFPPHEFDALEEAYDAAWCDMWTNRLTLTAGQTTILKRNLIQMLLAAACHGVRDANQLQVIALRGVSGGAGLSHGGQIIACPAVH